MNHSDLQHHDRFEQMKSDVNRRQIDWWFYRPNNKPLDETANAIVEILKTQQLVVGPFGEPFVKKNEESFKDYFYDIPLQHLYLSSKVINFSGVAYVATNEESSILLTTVADYLRINENHKAFMDLELSALCVQTAINNSGQRIVVTMSFISHLTPLAFYEHPANGRLLMAMNGTEYPDQSALVIGGTQVPPTVHVQEAMMQATTLYNNYQLGNIEHPELNSGLLSLFIK